MLISPPYLSTPQGNTESNDDYVARNMQGGEPGDGAFPVSFEFKWHGGIHLTAPASLARAIADGTVKYIRQPRNSCQADDPLDYYKGWTSDGVVVIEHKTEIGENVEVTYYSVYQHLSAIADNVKGDKPIYRKDEVGRAGYIYGEPNKFHFEICCDHDNLKKLIGRNSGKLDLSKDGRTDALWGDMYFALPAGTKIYGSDMVAAQKKVNAKAAAAAKAQEHANQAANKAAQTQQAATAATQAAAAAPGNAALAQKKTTAAQEATKAQQESTKAQNALTKAQADATQAANDYAKLQQQAPDYITSKLLFVGLAYERGNCTLTTYEESGDVVGTVPAAGYEYGLYTEATDLYPDCASAGFELLRFGRVIGPDALSPADAAHWRKIAYPGAGGWSPGGEGWVNLRPDAIKKFSDADFPHWRRWTLIDDDTDGDSRCDSKALKAIVLDNEQRSVDERIAPERLKAPEVQRVLKRTICRLRSEWDPSDIDARWGWLKQDKPEQYSPLLNKCMTDDAFDKLKAHIQALAFWDRAKMGTDPHWYFEPREFIAIFKKCGWISKGELGQIYKTPDEKTREQYRVALNKVMRKYILITPPRQAHFFGQGAVESTQLQSMVEGSQDQKLVGGVQKGGKIKAASLRPEKDLGHWYGAIPTEADDYYSKEKFNSKGVRFAGSYSWILGNCGDTDAQKFRGRGFKQLTGLYNYSQYWVYRGWLSRKDFDAKWDSDSEYKAHQPSRMTLRPPPIDDPQRISVDEYNCIDSGGFYITFERPKVKVSIDSDASGTNDEPVVKAVTLAINGGLNGYDQRLANTKHAKKILL